MHSPTKAVGALKWLGVNVVTLANNHILDYGAAGLKSTISALDVAGISHFGAGQNLAQASRAAVLEPNVLRICFLGFGGPRYPTKRCAGTIPFGDGRANRLIRDFRIRCDFLVVYFHEGIEALNYPLKRTMRACHKAVECGADVVIGTHPHIVQGMEHYRGVPIAYSLGNFILPMLVGERYEQWRRLMTLTRLGIRFDKDVITMGQVLRCTLTPRQPVRAAGVPIVLGAIGLPRLPVGEEAEKREAFLAQLCHAFGHPDDTVWRHRDEIERMYNRSSLAGITWKDILRNWTRIRPRHARVFLRRLWG